METVLVFVHLGVKLPKYLLANIRRTKKLFPEIRIVLIGDVWDSLASAEGLGIETYLHDSRRQAGPEGRFGYSQHFRGGFWSATMNRILVLAEWHAQNQDLRVVHLESDVMAFSNFPFENFKGLKNLAWLKVNGDHDCGAIIFSPHGGASKWLGDRLLDEINQDATVTDMVALSRIRRKNSSSIELLPTWDRSWSNGATEAYRELCDDSVFPGIFDAATLGMWLLGRDPRNHRGFTPYLMDTPEHQIDTQGITFELKDFDRLQVVVSGLSKPLYNLHVHSKNKLALGQLDLREISKRVIKAKERIPYREFSLRAAQISAVETLRSIFNRELIPRGILRLRNLMSRRQD